MAKSDPNETYSDCKEDEVLKRMLSTPPKKNEATTPLGKRRPEGRETQGGEKR